MRRSKRWAALLLVMVMVSFPAPTQGQEGAGGASGAPASGGASPLDALAARVTLVTGDRVDVRPVGDEPVVQVEPGPGRDGVHFSVQRARDQLYVIPSDAVGLLQADRLDRRLFDVATLAAFGYDDAHRSDLPLIVQAERPGGSLAETTLAQAGAEVESLPALSTSALRQPKDRAGELWAALAGAGPPPGGDVPRTLGLGIGKLWLDGLRHPTLDVSVPQIGAPAAWEAGYTGAGVRIGVLDTGIDATHPDLAAAIAASQNFTDEPDTDDGFGHGTHVASTLVGSGAASGGRYRGVAPDAQLLVGKVCDASGGCPDSAILAGMQWAVDSGARVVNLSLGASDTPGTDPLEAAIDTLSARHGTLFVVAAGNDGPSDGTVGTPASADAALAVGAVDDDDHRAEFSSMGPRLGDAALKPEITAPGVGIVAARARNGFIGQPADDGYVSLDGTSMATPHVAAAAALVAQPHPDWTGSQLKALLVGAATTTPGEDAFGQGAGRVDVSRAVSQQVHAEPSVVSAGRQAWPHGDDEPVRRTVTYRNPGPTPVTLALAVDTLAPDGGTAPTGTFSLGAEQVTVPAGGEAGVAVTIDTSGSGPDGHYSAWIVARGPGTVVTTPVAVDREPESYELTVAVRDRDGHPASLYDAQVFGLDRWLWQFRSEPGGTFTVRLPRGRYLVDARVQTPRQTGVAGRALLVQPLVDLDRDQTVELDAQRSEPFDIAVEPGDPQLRLALVGYKRGGEAANLTSGLAVLGSLDGVTAGSFGPEVSPDEMVSGLQSTWATPVPGAGGAGGQAYHLAWFDYGRMMSGLSRHVREAQLARVRSEQRAGGDGRSGLHLSMPHPTGSELGGGIGLGRSVPLPARSTELYNTRGVEWSGGFIQMVPDPGDPNGPPLDELWLDSDVQRYRAGRTYRERWNAAVLGPLVSDGSSFVCTEQPEQTSERSGDRITVTVALLSDAAGHTGCGPNTAAHTTLSRDGQVVGETPFDGFGQFDVPTEAATYRLETETIRPPSAVLSTRVTAAWSFTSGPVAGSEPEPLPLIAVRFAPELDAGNRAPAGARYEIPLTVDQLGAHGRISRPSVEASFDDGATWAPARVTRRTGGGYVASLTHPAGGGHVSLRATVGDSHGNTVEQTIIRAYQIQP